MSTTQHKLAGTAPYTDLSFWLYSVEDKTGKNPGNATLSALYDEPFDGIERAEKVIQAEKLVSGKHLVPVALPPSECEGRRVIEVLADMGRRQTLYAANSEEFKGVGAQPELKCEVDATGLPSGEVWMYVVWGEKRLLRPLMTNEIPGFDARLYQVEHVRCADMRRGLISASMLRERGITVVPFPFPNAAGATLPYVAAAMMRSGTVMSVMDTGTGTVIAARELDPDDGKQTVTTSVSSFGAKTTITTESPAKAETRWPVSALRPGEIYCTGDTINGDSIVVAQPNVAKMPDGGWLYGICVETGRLYSTVADADKTWVHVKGGM